MASFLEAQLDYIFFFYGLAFILLGAVCFAIQRGPLGKTAGIGMLGLFGVIHGVGEWLDLAALTIGDSSVFCAVRVVVIATSYGFLLEFARRGLRMVGFHPPGPWIFLPLYVVVVAAGLVGGLSSADAMARYLIGFSGAMGAAYAMKQRARTYKSSFARKMTVLAAGALATYGVFAGLIVSPAPFWPADVINVRNFLELTGVPIQLVRALLATALTLLIWAIWGQLLVMSVASQRYTDYLHRQFVGTMVAMATIFGGGWVLTDLLGGVYRDNVQREARGDAELVGGRLSGETAATEAMVKSLANAPVMRALLAGGGDAAAHAGEVLRLDLDAADAQQGVVFDVVGRPVLSSGLNDGVRWGGAEESQAAYFQAALAGAPGYRFTTDSEGVQVFDAAAPVRAGDGRVAGVVVMRKSLRALDTGLQNFDRAIFFVDGAGVVRLTNRAEQRGKRLWPSKAEVRVKRTDAEAVQPPLLAREVIDSQWAKFGGKRGYVLRTPVGHGQWSLVVTIPMSGIFASRFLGIVITLQLSIVALFYFFGREHGVRDNIQMEQRIELQERARGLELQASTDPLTGLYNRWRFNEGLQDEIARYHRQGMAFSLVFFDIDHFKEVNDIYGHQTGDHVLYRLAGVVSQGLRQTDLLARWGGEEFILMLLGDSGEDAMIVAEKLRATIAHTAFDSVGTVTCSFGVAECTVGDSSDSLIARADNALYRAKLNGRNRVELASLPLLEAPDLMPAE